LLSFYDGNKSGDLGFHSFLDIFAVDVDAAQDGNSQSFLGKFVRFFVTLRCFDGVVIHRK